MKRAVCQVTGTEKLADRNISSRSCINNGYETRRDNT